MTRQISAAFVLCVLIVAPLRAQESPHDAGKIRIACVGDSITYGSGIRDREKNSYPAQLQQMLGAGYDVRNFGVGGATLLKKGDKPYWQQKAFEEAKDFAPQVVIIKLGTNDSKPQNWKFKDQFAGDLKQMIGEFRSLQSKPQIWLCRPVPAFPGNWGIREEVIKGEVIPIIDSVAREQGAKIIDLYSALQGRKEMFPDTVHPNAQGAKVMAQTIYTALTEAATAQREAAAKQPTVAR